LYFNPPHRVFNPIQTSTTRTFLVNALKGLGYNIIELLLTPLQFGIPNSRLRYYLLAKRSPLSFPHTDGAQIVWRHIPGQGLDWVDPRESTDHALEDTSLRTIREFILPEPIRHPTKALPFIPDRVLEKWGRLFDIVRPSSARTCCFTRGIFRIRCLYVLYEQLSNISTHRVHSNGRTIRLSASAKRGP
jgi:tRNA (cytosine38-C5)-methyltransferase